MATQLVKAAEALIEAAVKESVVASINTSKAAVDELRHIHGALDKQGQALEKALEASLDKHFRVLRLQQAMALVPNWFIEWYTSSYDRMSGSSAQNEIRRMLAAAIKGVGFALSKNWTMEAQGGRTHEAFRNQLSSYLHGLTGIEPRFELQGDQSYTMFM